MEMESSDSNIQEDRVSNLTDDILLIILEKLNIREVVRMSILSRRWRQLPTCLSKLVIDIRPFLDCGGTSDSTYKELADFTVEELAPANGAVIEATKQLLASRSDYTINALCIQFCLSDDYMSIGRAVDNAMVSGKVGATAELSIFTEDSDTSTDDDLIDYGRRLMSMMGACPHAFGGLTRLHLENMAFGASDIPNILSACKKLKALFLNNCDCGTGTLLQIRHAQLTELTMLSCPFRRVELNWLPKLARFICQEWWSAENPLSLGYVPCLHMLTLWNTSLVGQKPIKLSRLLANTAITILFMNFCGENIWIQPESRRRLAPVLRKLRNMNLTNLHYECDPSWTMFLLEAAPLLRNFCIKVWNHVCDEETDEEEMRMQMLSNKKNVAWKVGDSKHYSLIRLTIMGFQNTDKKLMRFLRHVMETAVNLEEIHLFNKGSCEKCDYMDPHIWHSTGLRFPQTKDEEDWVRNQILDGRSTDVQIFFHEKNHTLASS